MLVVTKTEMLPWNLESKGSKVTKWIKWSFAEMRNTGEQVLAGEDEYSWVWDAYPGAKFQ